MITIEIIVYVVCGCYLLLNLRHDIHMLQQNSYRLKRYWKYLKDDITGMSRLVDVALLFLVFSTLLPPLGAAIIVGVVCLIKMSLLIKKKFKKPLVYTRRVMRIYSVAGAISLGLFLAVILATGFRNGIFGVYAASTLSLG
ncbi:MAG: hypothetical protein K2G69_03900, partial [Muribaculaceae bacterium]|nr:hypothetical protein [Muribaculaceae bacterium]